MKRLIIAGSAALSALGTLVARARDHAAEIRDMAEVGPEEALAARIRSVLGPRNDDSRTVVDLIDELCEELDRRVPEGWLMLPEDFFTHAADFEEAIELAISCTGDPEGYWTHQLKTLRLARIAAGYGPDGWGGGDLEVTP